MGVVGRRPPIAGSATVYITCSPATSPRIFTRPYETTDTHTHSHHAILTISFTAQSYNLMHARAANILHKHSMHDPAICQHVRLAYQLTTQFNGASAYTIQPRTSSGRLPAVCSSIIFSMSPCKHVVQYLQASRLRRRRSKWRSFVVYLCHCPCRCRRRASRCVGGGGVYCRRCRPCRAES